nr:ABC transporter substrate-binding protein [Amycolatopsis sp.]
MCGEPADHPVSSIHNGLGGVGMTSRTGSRPGVLAAGLVIGAILAGCGQSGGTGRPGAGFGTEDIVAQVRTDDSAAALVPADVRTTGVLTFGSAIGSAPIAFFGTDNKTAYGVDIDFSNAVGRVLGLRVDRQKISGPEILTGLLSGKFQVATANFAVTAAREKVLDFVTYMRDGGGFAVPDSSTLTGSVTDLIQLCGRTVGTGVGTTYDQELEQSKSRCAAAGRQPYRIETYSDAAGQFLALREGRIEVLMSTASVLRYAVTQQPGMRFLNQYGTRDIGFGLRRGSPLAPALSAAVNKLIADGTYAKVLAKWHFPDTAAIGRSEISPPEPPG